MIDAGSGLHVDVGRMADNFTWVNIVVPSSAALANLTPLVLAAPTTGRRWQLHGLWLVPQSPQLQLFVLRSGTVDLIGQSSGTNVAGIIANTGVTAFASPLLWSPSVVPYQVGVVGSNINLYNMSGASASFGGVAVLKQV